MDELLNKTLASDETLLWSGSPESFETFDRTYKPIFIRKLIISLVIAAALTAAYFIAAGDNDVGVKWGLLIFVWIVCILPPINVPRDSKLLKTKIRYAVTDKRYLTLSNTVRDVEIAKCGKAYFVTDADGHTSFVTGMEGEKNLKANMREAAVVGVSMDTEADKCDRYVMYAVSDVEGLKQALKKTEAEF
ncbi:MAG: hypothetical protein Q4E35_05355 [Eubacteriales bacterium]|nr:hypothetical protein [Eubacteriales bacterium]